MKGRWAEAAVGAGLAAGMVALAHVPRAEVAWLLAGWVGMLGLAGVGVALAWRRRWGLGAMLAVGLGLRAVVAVLAPEPRWSEDWLRYAWDGWLVAQGELPYGVTPDAWVEAQPGGTVEAYAEQLREGMNSPGYHAIYPPVAQAVFAAVEWGRKALGGGTGSWLALFRGVLLLSEAWVLWGLWRLLERWRGEGRWAWVYALHPLGVVEGIANVHFETLWVGALVAAGLGVSRWSRVGAWGLAVGVKVVPVFLLPGVVWATRRKGWWAIGGVGLGLVGAGVLWGVEGMGAELEGWGRSAALFFRTFEFHPGLYAVARAAVAEGVGYNAIAVVGPALGALGWGAAAAVGVWGRRWHWGERFTLGWGCILATATTVHPWYFVALLAGGVGTRWVWPALWASTSAVSYVRYSATGGADAAALDLWWLLSWGLNFLALAWDMAGRPIPQRRPRMM